LMNELDALMIRAIERDGLGITPCAGKKFSECYTGVAGSLLFWYNNASGNTRVVSFIEPEPAEPEQSSPVSSEDAPS